VERRAQALEEGVGHGGQRVSALRPASARTSADAVKRRECRVGAGDWDVAGSRTNLRQLLEIKGETGTPREVAPLGSGHVESPRGPWPAGPKQKTSSRRGLTPPRGSQCQAVGCRRPSDSCGCGSESWNGGSERVCGRRSWSRCTTTPTRW